MSTINQFAILLECDPGTTLGGSCFRDVHNMAVYLIKNCNFDPQCIYILTTNQPSKRIINVNYFSANDIFILADKISLLKPEFVLLLLSGHGFATGDTNGDESDHQDEAIMINKGLIIDDEIYSRVVSKFNCDMILLSDTCHSGTMFDLPFVWSCGNNVQGLATIGDNEIYPRVYSLSACSDSQLSMCDVGENTGFGGSLCTSLLNDINFANVITNCNKIKMIDLLNKVSAKLILLNQTVVLSSNSKF